MIPKRRKRERMMAPKDDAAIRCPSHLKWLRGFDCAIANGAGHTCEGKIEAAHVRIGTDGGTSLKPSDCYAIPLCSAAHAEQHRIGERSFEWKYGLQMKVMALKLWLQSPAGKKYRLEHSEPDTGPINRPPQPGPPPSEHPNSARSSGRANSGEG